MGSAIHGLAAKDVIARFGSFSPRSISCIAHAVCIDKYTGDIGQLHQNPTKKIKFCLTLRCSMVKGREEEDCA